MVSLRKTFNQHGFVISAQLFPKQVLAQIHTDLNALLDQSLLSLGMNDLPNSLELKFIKLHRADQNLYLGTVRAMSRLLSIQQAFVSKEVQALYSLLGIKLPLIPTGPVVHVMSEKLKIAEGYFGQGAHQDWTSMQGSLNALVFWVALTDVSEQNYPVEVVSGSHLHGLIQGKMAGHYFEVPSTLYPSDTFQPVCCQAGDALIFSSFLVHRSAVEGKSGFRLAVSFRFDDATEQQLISRHYPTAYKRSVDRELKTEDIPSLNAIEQVYQDTV